MRYLVLTVIAILGLAIVISCRTEGRGATQASGKATVADFYVATNGNDTWSGRLAEPSQDKTNGPFRTVEKAREALRKQNTSSLGQGKKILVRGGFYTFQQSFLLTDQDSGTPGHPVVIQAYPGESVIFGGGPTIPAEAFTQITNTGVLSRLDPLAREHVLQVDLRALGINRLGRFPPKNDGGPAVSELFFNAQRMTLARWPNEGWTTIAKIIASGSDYSGNEAGIFEYAGDRPARWNLEEGIWLHGFWAFDWNAEILQVKSIDLAKHQIGLVTKAVYSIKQGNPTPRRYYAFNLLEELDRAGEYYIDRNAGLLYFWPPAPLTNSTVMLSVLQAPVISIKNAANLVMRGFTLEATIGNGMEVHNSTNVSIQACEVRNSSGIGIVVEGGASNTVEACDVHDTGKGGISLAGGDRKTLTPGAHAAINNHIWRFACLKLTYSDGLRIGGVGNRAAHNLIHDAPHQAIGLSGNDHILEYNIVHHVCMETDDCGAFYKGRNPSCRGNIIRYNFWHHIGNPMGHGNAAIYFDDGDGGESVIGNVFFQCGDPGKGSFGSVFSHGGHDNLAENNIFIECKRALGSSPWPDDLWRSVVKRNGNEGWNWGNKLLEEVNITQPPYTTRYPELVGFMDPQPGQLRVNRARNNLLVMCGQVSSGKWQYETTDIWVTDTDPGFVNAAKGDFRLKLNSDVFTKLPGFKPVPFAKMGLYENELRPHFSPEEWTYGELKPLPPINSVTK